MHETSNFSVMFCNGIVIINVVCLLIMIKFYIQYILFVLFFYILWYGGRFLFSTYLVKQKTQFKAKKSGNKL